ncbi:MAG: UDP-glucose 4-epimerase GalE [Polyangiaceae bacterium]
MARRILVTGGAGYVGSHAVRALLGAGCDVVVLDDLSTGHRAAVSSEVELIVGDVRDEAAVERAFSGRGLDAVFHFAARSIVPDSVRDPLGYLDGNIGGAHAILRAALAHDVERFVLSSTAAVYGEPEVALIDEEQPLAPTNPYGESKLVIERTLSWLGKAHGLRWAALRYFNAAGASSDGSIGEDHRPETHLVPIVLEVARGRREAVYVFGTDYDTPDGTCVRDYVHVCDLADAHLAALDALENEAQLVLNLGCGVGRSVREIVKVAREVTGKAIATIDAPRRGGDPPVLVADPSRAQKVLGWKARRSDPRTILETAWRFHTRHPDGYK